MFWMFVLSCCFSYRMATVIVDDGQNRSVPAAIRIVVIPASDGPILRFTPPSQPLQFASLADRSHSITFTENGSPVKILPNDTVLVDVDSFYAGNATFSFNTTRTGDIILVDVSIASSHGVTVIGQGTSSAYLSGIASFAAYLEVKRPVHHFSAHFTWYFFRYCFLLRTAIQRLNRRKLFLRLLSWCGIWKERLASRSLFLFLPRSSTMVRS